MLYDDGKNVRLLYELEVPMYPQEAQEQLGILKTGDLTIQVRVSPMLSSHLTQAMCIIHSLLCALNGSE